MDNLKLVISIVVGPVSAQFNIGMDDRIHTGLAMDIGRSKHRLSWEIVEVVGDGRQGS